MYLYKLYGLYVQCDFKIKGIKEVSSEKIDVRIISSDFLKSESYSFLLDKSFYYSENLTYLKIEGLMESLVVNGDYIFLNSFPNYDYYSFRTFLLGSCFGILMAQRGQVVLHAGTVVINDNEALAITGESGAGKSTLVTALRLEGYKFLSDDISVLSRAEEGALLVEPALPEQKISLDMMESFGYDSSCYDVVEECRGKYIISDNENFIDKAKKLKYLIEVIEDEGVDSAELEQVISIEKVDMIIKNIYRGEIFLKEKLRGEYFHDILKITKDIKCYKLKRAKGKITINKQKELILSIDSD